MNASNNIFLAKTNTSSGISIENEFHFLSDNVIQDGQDRETFSKYDDEPKEAEKPEKGFNWCALAIFAVAAVVAVPAIVFTAGILAAAIVGACVAVACTAVGDMITGEMSSFKDYFLSALSGAICGAIFGPLKIASLLGLMGVGALEGGLDSLIRQLGNGEFSFKTLLIDMGLGALLTGIFYNLGKVVRRIAPRAKNALQNAIRKAMPRIKSALNRVKEGAAIRVKALIRALKNNDVPLTRGVGSNFCNLNPDYISNLKKSYNEAKKDITEKVSNASESGLESKGINTTKVTPPGSTHSVDVYTDGNAQINTGKIDTYIRAKVEADVDYLQARIKELKDMKKADSAAFDKSLAKELKTCEDKLHNYQRSQEMSTTLNNAGIIDTAENNEMIAKNLLEAAKSVESGKTEVISYIEGPNGKIQIVSRWKILEDGTPYLATVILKPIK